MALNLGEVTLSCSSLLRVVELVWLAGVARDCCYIVKCIHFSTTNTCRWHLTILPQSQSHPTCVNPLCLISNISHPPHPAFSCTHTAQHHIPKLLVPDSVLHSAPSAPLTLPRTLTQLLGLASLHATALPFNSFPRCNLAARPSSQLSVLYS